MPKHVNALALLVLLAVSGCYFPENECFDLTGPTVSATVLIPEVDLYEIEACVDSDCQVFEVSSMLGTRDLGAMGTTLTLAPSTDGELELQLGLPGGSGTRHVFLTVTDAVTGTILFDEYGVVTPTELEMRCNAHSGSATVYF